MNNHQPPKFARRESAAARGYGYRWRKIRLIHLRQEPLCRACAEAGRVTPATEVDHIDGDPHNNAPMNHQSLCGTCHKRKTVNEQGALDAR